MDQIDRVIRGARAMGRIRQLGQQPPETALSELQRLLSPATADAVLREVVLQVQSFGAQATALLPALEKLDDHDDPGVRSLARSAAKRIRKAAKPPATASPSGDGGRS